MEDANASPNANAKAAVDYAVWPPSQQMRDRLVERIATNLTAMSFFDEKVKQTECLIRAPCLILSTLHCIRRMVGRFIATGVLICVVCRFQVDPVWLFPNLKLITSAFAFDLRKGATKVSHSIMPQNVLKEPDCNGIFGLQDGAHR